MTVSIPTHYEDSYSLITRTRSDPSAYARLEHVLLDTSLPMADRFRAVFTLKSLGTVEAVDVLTKCTRFLP